LLSTLLISCGEGERRSTPPAAASIDLIARLGEAQVEAPEPKYVGRHEATVGGVSRAALYMHPPSKAAFPPIRATLDSRLELSFGVADGVWEQPGDGVRFSVLAVVAGREPVRLFSSYVDPKRNLGDRRWVDATVTLGTFSGQDVRLVLETDPGSAGDIGWDWASWSRVEWVSGAASP
jgi:hypothetical protein